MGKAQGLEGGTGWPPVNGAAFFAQAGVGATFAAGAYAGGSGGSVGASFDVAVSDEYQAAIMDADTDGDGTLSAAELAADPQAAAMVEAIQQSICDQLPSCSDPSTVEVQGVSAGRRRMQEGVVQTLQVRMDGAYAATLGDTNGDGLLSAAEIAAGELQPLCALASAAMVLRKAHLMFWLQTALRRSLPRYCQSERAAWCQCNQMHGCEPAAPSVPIVLGPFYLRRYDTETQVAVC